MQRVALPIFPAPGSRVRIPAPVGGYHVTWTMTEAREVDGRLCIKCGGWGGGNAAKVRKI